ncbi:unnamed protein product, partial [Cuscuta campestris]
PVAPSTDSSAADNLPATIRYFPTAAVTIPVANTATICLNKPISAAGCFSTAVTGYSSPRSIHTGTPTCPHTYSAAGGSHLNTSSASTAIHIYSADNLKSAGHSPESRAAAGNTPESRTAAGHATESGTAAGHATESGTAAGHATESGTAAGHTPESRTAAGNTPESRTAAGHATESRTASSDNNAASVGSRHSG